MSAVSIKPRVLLDGLAMVESPRWHDGRLWFPHWGTDEVLAVDLDGNVEVVARRPSSGLGDGIAFLPDGRLLITGERLMRQEPDGSLVEHCDLSHLTEHGWSEITVDGRGNIYVNSINFDFMAGEEPDGAPGIVALVTTDGVARQVADEIAFPNGMVVTPDNRTLIIAESFAAQLTAFDIAEDGTLSNRRAWAKDVGPDGICMDADGAIYCSSKPGEKDLLRVREGREVSGPDRARSVLLRHRPRGPRPPDAFPHVRRMGRHGGRRGQHREAHRPGPGRRRPRTGRRLAVGQTIARRRAG